jgi:hypothetical protein
VSPSRLLKTLTSARATMLLLCLLALLLALSVMLPQAPIVGEEVVAERVAGRPLYGFFMVTLGFQAMATSPVFLAAIALFFLNLTIVLLSRIGPTLRRTRARARPEKGILAWTSSPGALVGPWPAGGSAAQSMSVLRSSGYAVQQVGDRSAWGVKHRTAALGFLIFHASFFLLFAGGLQLWYTRFVAIATMSEGQEFSGEYTRIERVPPLGLPRPVPFGLEEVQTRFEDGEPVHLGAVFRLGRGDSAARLTSRVNHPARWGSTSLLVNEAGLAPVLWLQDAAGRTVDRVVAPIRTRGGEASELPLAAGRLSARIEPIDGSRGWPARDELPDLSLVVRIERRGALLFEGPLQIGQAADLDGERLVLEEIRYWVNARVVDERGGGLLIAGFVTGIIGLIWRLPACRREIALSWTESEFRLVGNSEYFPQRFEGELGTIASLLADPPPALDLSPRDRRSEDGAP